MRKNTFFGKHEGLLKALSAKPEKKMAVPQGTVPAQSSWLMGGFFKTYPNHSYGIAEE
jgi:hypothetical protein